MNKDCPICKLILDASRPKIYEDDKVVVFAQRLGAVPGQVMVVPREHYPIIELIPDNVLSDLGDIANKVSVAVFDAMGFTGTNILCSNGIPAGQKIAHCGLQIIPRRESDKFNFTWVPKQLGEEEMSTIELKLKQEAESIGGAAPPEMKRVKIESDHKPELLTGSDEEENYALKQLDRMP